MENSNGSDAGSRVARKILRLSELNFENDSTNCVEVVQDCQAIEHKFPKWTNKEHSSYLKSLETSFVNQLYDSKDNLGRHPPRECASEITTSGQKQPVIATPSGQYKVFQDGSRTRINFRRKRPQPKQAYESGNILSNPWIQHYWLPCNKGSTITGETIIEGNAEATDQNFIEEEKEERKQDIKCRKFCVADGLKHDQCRLYSRACIIERVGSNGHGLTHYQLLCFG